MRMVGAYSCMLILSAMLMLNGYQKALVLADHSGQHHLPLHSVYHVVQSTDECNSIITNSTESPSIVCNTLQFFISNVPRYFTSNTTFYIAEGHHILDTMDLQIVSVNGIHDLTLFGQGRGVTVIECGRNTKGFYFANSGGISIIGIDLINCGQAEQNTPTIRLYNSQSVALEQTGISDSHIGLIAESTLSVSVMNSSFTNITGYGISISNACNVTVISTSFMDNDIGILEVQNSNSSLMCFDPIIIHTSVTNCSFERNHDKAIDLYSDIETQLQVTGSYFYQNGIFNRNMYSRYDAALLVYVTGDDATSILISECNFIGNLKRAVLVYATSLTLKQSTFKDNIVVVYSPNLGGSALSTFNAHLNITDSIFINNSAIPVAMGRTTGILSYGGAILQASTVNGFVYLNNLTLVNNTADYGGGLCLYVQDLAHPVVLSGLTLEGNTARIAGGGLSAFITGSDVQSNLVITGSRFHRNHAPVGAGANVKFISSGVAIIDAELDPILTNSGAFVRIDNCTFTDNEAELGGGIYGSNNLIPETAYNCRFEVSKTIIANNRGSGVRLTSCDMVFTNGHTLFSNNTTPLDGGGLYLNAKSRLNTTNNGSVGFINNTAGRYGGAIFSEDADISVFHTYSVDTYLADFVSRECTLDLNMIAKFIDNRAEVAGNDLYGGTFIYCNYMTSDLLINFIESYYSTFSNILECPKVPTVLKEKALGGAGYKGMPLSSSVSSEPLGVCSCNENTGIDCTNKEAIVKTIFPGESFTVSLATIGLCGGVSPGHVTYNKETPFPLTTSKIKSNTSVSLCQQYNYAPEINRISDTNITFTIQLILSNTRLQLANQSGTVVVQLTVLPCPLGLILDPLVRECVCDSTLTTINGVSCNVSHTLPIQRSGNNWIAFEPDLNCTVVHDGCPFDYCISSAVQFKLNESNPQCNHHRAGTLCGECLPGLSVQLGGNQCADCSSISSIYITLVFLIAGILLVFLILVLNLTVSIGTINGVLFYANVVQLNSSEFGLQRESVPVIDQFISWINLDLGIQTCFINGLDDYGKLWLQLLFPLYIWIIVIGIILAYHYSTRLSKYCSLNPPVPVLATLILMSYTKLLRTLTAIFTYTRVVCGELEWIAWARDGNVEFARGKHVPLFIVGIVILMLALVYTGLVFSAQWLVRYSGVCCRSTRDPVVKLKPFIDAYTGPYKVKYRFWVGLGLIARVVFTVSFSLTSGSSSNVNNILIALVVFSMSLFHNRVYRSRIPYVLEMLSFFNLFVLALITGMVTESLTVTIVSVSFEIILFIAVILIHLYKALTRKWPKLKHINKLILLMKKSSTNIRSPTNSTELDEYDYGEVVNRRDSIIFSV